MRTENIESVMCNGRWIMKNRKILTVDEVSDSFLHQNTIKHAWMGITCPEILPLSGRFSWSCFPVSRLGTKWLAMQILVEISRDWTRTLICLCLSCTGWGLPKGSEVFYQLNGTRQYRASIKNERRPIEQIQPTGCIKYGSVVVTFPLLMWFENFPISFGVFLDMFGCSPKWIQGLLDME